MATDETVRTDTQGSPLTDLGIHAAGDPNSAEPNPEPVDDAGDDAHPHTRAPDDLDSPRNPENDPVSDLPDIDTATSETPQKGKLVFGPGELNNAGEDKEYFHPKNNHHFEVPKDANEHALTPDVEVAPGNIVKTIE